MLKKNNHALKIVEAYKEIKTQETEIKIIKKRNFI